MASAAPRFGMRAVGPRTRLALGVALLLSLVVHLALTFLPTSMPEPPDSTPLMATLTEMPPPPLPAAQPVAKPKPRVKRAPPVAVPAPAPADIPAEAPAAVAPSDAQGQDTAAADAQARCSGSRAGSHSRRSRHCTGPAAARRPGLQRVLRHDQASHRRGGLPVRTRGQPVPDPDRRQGARPGRAGPARTGQAPEPRTHHADGVADAGVRRRTRRPGPSRIRGLRLGSGHRDDARRQDRRARHADLRPDDAHVAVLFHAAHDRPGVVQPGHAAADDALHGHARGNRERSTGSRARSTPSAGIAAATTARPTPTSGSRRRCATFRSRCAWSTPTAARSRSCSDSIRVDEAKVE